MEMVQFIALEQQQRLLVVCSFVEAAVVNTLLAAHKSLSCLIMLDVYVTTIAIDFGQTVAVLTDVDGLPDLTEKRFPMDELHRGDKPVAENKDGSDTEDDDEDDDDDADGQDDDDDDGDEDFSGGEGGDDDEGDPEANGNEGSDDDDDDDDDDGDEDEVVEDDDEDEEEEDEDEEDQPPAKKKK